jgi:hypothetical protein
MSRLWPAKLYVVSGFTGPRLTATELTALIDALRLAPVTSAPSRRWCMPPTQPQTVGWRSTARRPLACGVRRCIASASLPPDRVRSSQARAVPRSAQRHEILGSLYGSSAPGTRNPPRKIAVASRDQDVCGNTGRRGALSPPGGPSFPCSWWLLPARFGLFRPVKRLRSWT